MKLSQLHENNDYNIFESFEKSFEIDNNKNKETTIGSPIENEKAAKRLFVEKDQLMDFIKKRYRAE